jgi:hypothetical protein
MITDNYGQKLKEGNLYPKYCNMKTYNYRSGENKLCQINVQKY